MSSSSYDSGGVAFRTGQRVCLHGLCGPGFERDEHLNGCLGTVLEDCGDSYRLLLDGIGIRYLRSCFLKAETGSGPQPGSFDSHVKMGRYYKSITNMKEVLDEKDLEDRKHAVTCYIQGLLRREAAGAHPSGWASDDELHPARLRARAALRVPPMRVLLRSAATEPHGRSKPGTVAYMKPFVDFKKTEDPDLQKSGKFSGEDYRVMSPLLGSTTFRIAVARLICVALEEGMAVAGCRSGNHRSVAGVTVAEAFLKASGHEVESVHPDARHFETNTIRMTDEKIMERLHRPPRYDPPSVSSPARVLMSTLFPPS